ncbi:MAG: hypothetical protein R2857_03870 [Vampirovibrionales bacterium]
MSVASGNLSQTGMVTVATDHVDNALSGALPWVALTCSTAPPSRPPPETCSPVGGTVQGDTNTLGDLDRPYQRGA